MTRKDYIAIASALNVESPTRTNNPMMTQESFKRIVQNIADVLQADNPRFDRKRFLQAAGL